MFFELSACTCVSVCASVRVYFASKSVNTSVLIVCARVSVYMCVCKFECTEFAICSMCANVCVHECVYVCVISYSDAFATPTLHTYKL